LRTFFDVMIYITLGKVYYFNLHE